MAKIYQYSKPVRTSYPSCDQLNSCERPGAGPGYVNPGKAPGGSHAGESKDYSGCVGNAREGSEGAKPTYPDKG